MLPPFLTVSCCVVRLQQNHRVWLQCPHTYLSQLTVSTQHSEPVILLVCRTHQTLTYASEHETLHRKCVFHVFLHLVFHVQIIDFSLFKVVGLISSYYSWFFTFYLSGHVNIQSNKQWSTQNPHVICVWYVLSATQMMSLVYYPDTTNSEQYEWKILQRDQ